jgi:ribosome-associated protein
MLVVTDRIAIPDEEIRFEFARSGGPGGQNVNKVASKATLRWTPAANATMPPAVRDRLLRALSGKLTVEGELLISSQKTRDQSRNIEDCLDKLREIIRAASRPPKVRRATKPTRASQIRRVEEKGRRSDTKRLRRRPESD